MVSLSCVSICPTSYLLQRRCHSSVIPRLEQDRSLELHKSRETLNDAVENVSRGIWCGYSGFGEMEKDPHHQAAFQINLCKMTLSEVTWGNSGGIAQINLSFTFQRAGNRNSLAVCVCVWQFQKSSGQLKPELMAFGPIIISVLEVWQRTLKCWVCYQLTSQSTQLYSQSLSPYATPSLHIKSPIFLALGAAQLHWHSFLPNHSTVPER